MKRLLLLLLLALPAFAQEYVAVKNTSLNAAPEIITVQQPATGARTVRFRAFYADCSVACTITLLRNGTAATTTTLSTMQINPSVGVASTANAFSASNVGVGSLIGSYNLQAGGSITVDLSGSFMQGNGTCKNLTVSTNSITGTVNIIIKWQEITP